VRADEATRRALPPEAPEPRAPRPATRDAARPRKEKEPEPPASTASNAEPGTLRINSRPWSAVTLDGKRIGNTPLLDLKVPPGTHVVELHNPEQRLKKKLTVRVRAGQTVTRVVELR
jgi:serine/threonine-protein kinase